VKAPKPKEKSPLFCNVEAALAQKNYTSARRYAVQFVKAAETSQEDDIYALLKSVPYDERPILVSRKNDTLVQRVNKRYELLKIDVDAFSPYELVAFIAYTGSVRTHLADITSRNELYALLNEADVPAEKVKQLLSPYHITTLLEFDKLRANATLSVDEERLYSYLKNEIRNMRRARLK